MNPTPQDGAAPAPTPENWQAFFKAASALSGDYGNLINTPIGHPALSSESLLERIGEFVGAHTQVAEYLEEYIEKAPQESPRPTTATDVLRDDFAALSKLMPYGDPARESLLRIFNAYAEVAGLDLNPWKIAAPRGEPGP